MQPEIEKFNFASFFFNSTKMSTFAALTDQKCGIYIKNQRAHVCKQYSNQI